MSHGERAAMRANRSKEFWGVDYRGLVTGIVMWVPRKLVRAVSRTKRKQQDRELTKEAQR